MGNILEKQTLEMKNVLSYRAKMNPQDLSVAMNKMGHIAKENGATKAGNAATATYSVEVIKGQQVMDIEILVPLDKEISTQGDYVFKPVFKIINALSIRHEGNPVLLQNTINQLNEHVIKNKLQVITATYNVTVKEPTSQADVDQMIVDVYVGISPNIL